MLEYIYNKLHKLSKSGFTFLEIMISLSIVGGVVVTTLVSLNYHLGIIDDNRSIIIATILGNEKVEEVGLYGLPEEKKGVFDDDFPQFSWQLDRSDVEALEGLKRTTVRVSWGKNRGVSLVSYSIDD